MLPKCVVLALLIPLSINLSGCSKSAPPTVVPTVGVATPEHRDIDVERDFVGEVAAVEQAEIRSKVNGRVLSVEFREGSLVTQGQPLFRIDSDSLRSAVDEAKASVSKATANLKKETTDEVRYKTLVDKGTISRQAYDDVRNRVAQAQAALESAQAQLEQAQTMLQESAIVSPYDGRIGRALVNVGNLVSANQTLLATVSTTAAVQVDFALSERDYLELVRPILESGKPRPRIEVKLLLADGSVYPETGQITFSDRSIASDTGTFAVAATFPNPHEVLRPGMFGRVRVVAQHLQNALVVPTRAIQEVLDKTFVSVVDSDSKVVRKEVKVGPKSGDYTNVVSGLSDGEQVIVDGYHKAAPGAKVIAKPLSTAASEASTPQA